MISSSQHINIVRTTEKFEFCTPLCLQIAFAMFGVYVLIDDKHVLDAQKVFVSMALINILKAPLSQLPFAMSTTMQVSGSTVIQTFERLCIKKF